MRWWVLRLVAVSLVLLSLMLVFEAGHDGFLSCAGAEYSPVNGEVIVFWRHPTACTIDGILPLRALGFAGLALGGAWLLRDILKPR